jgi:hypothetical protein
MADSLETGIWRPADFMVLAPRLLSSGEMGIWKIRWGESQPWLELARQRATQAFTGPLNLCQFLTLPIGEYYHHSVTGGPPQKAATPRRFVVPRNRRRSAKGYYDVGRMACSEEQPRILPRREGGRQRDCRKMRLFAKIVSDVGVLERRPNLSCSSWRISRQPQG